MKILLVGIYDTNTAALAPEMLRAYASRFAVARRFRIETLNLSIFSQSVEEMTERIRAERADVVGFSAYVWNIAAVRAIAPRLRARVIVGGPQCNEGADRLLAENPAIELAVRGEGEETFKELLEHWAGLRPLEGIAGVVTRSGAAAPRAVLEDLDAIPSPYPRLLAERPDVEWLAYETSRGCPFLCGFCTWGASRRMRYHGLERVFAELDLLLAQPGLRRLYLCDSSLLLDKPRAKRVLRRIIERGGGRVSLRFEFNAEHLDDEIIDLLMRLPGNELNFGLQTVTPRALREMRRPFDRRRFERNFAKLAARAGDSVLTMDLIYGLPGDDLEGYKASLDYAMSFPRLDWILTNPLVLLPGSDYARDAERHGLRLRPGSSGAVAASATFPEPQMREAVRLSFWVATAYFNSALREAMRAHAAERGARFVDEVAEFFGGLPFELLDGAPYPFMVPSEAREFRERNLAVRAVARRFPELVALYDARSRGRRSRTLSRYPEAFGPQFRRLERFAREDASREALSA